MQNDLREAFRERITPYSIGMSFMVTGSLKMLSWDFQLSIRSVSILSGLPRLLRQNKSDSPALKILRELFLHV